MQPDNFDKPTGTLVLLTNPERDLCRTKAGETAKKLGLSRMSLHAYIRWAALNMPLPSKETIFAHTSTETQMAQPA